MFCDLTLTCPEFKDSNSKSEKGFSLSDNVFISQAEIFFFLKSSERSWHFKSHQVLCRKMSLVLLLLLMLR